MHGTLCGLGFYDECVFIKSIVVFFQKTLALMYLIMYGGRQSK